MGYDGLQLSPDDSGTSKSGHGLLKAPSRSSSQQRKQASTASTGLSGATVTDPRGSLDRRSKESRRSIPERQRNGSASTQRTGDDSEQVVGNSQPSSPSTSEQKRRRKKNGGFLSLLGCCGIPDTANAIDEGDNENVHKIEKLPERPASAKSRTPNNREQPPGKHLLEKDTSQASYPADPTDTQGSGSTQDPTAAPERRPDQTAVAATQIDNAPLATATEASDAEDRNDLAPADAGVSRTVQVDAHETGLSENSGDTDNQTMSPSPSPGPAISSSSPVVENGPAVSEQQSWLLPPVAPEHKGRKCLVLDLDETLVHSSFKVRCSFRLAW